MNSSFSEQELADIREWFGTTPEQLDMDAFRKTLRELRVKYHPDNFEKFGDAVVLQLATERFQRIEKLAEKLEAWKTGKSIATSPQKQPAGADRLFNHGVFAFKEMRIEIRTSDKDLKYHLFGTFYRWLTLGDRFKIPESEAFLIADEEHAGRSIGFTETIRVYLTFEESDSVETIVDWLFKKIEGRAEALLIEGELVPVDYNAILFAVKKRSYKQLVAKNE